MSVSALFTTNWQLAFFLDFLTLQYEHNISTLSVRIKFIYNPLWNRQSFTTRCETVNYLQPAVKPAINVQQWLTNKSSTFLHTYTFIYIVHICLLHLTPFFLIFLFFCCEVSVAHLFSFLYWVLCFPSVFCNAIVHGYIQLWPLNVSNQKKQYSFTLIFARVQCWIVSH